MVIRAHLSEFEYGRAGRRPNIEIHKHFSAIVENAKNENYYCKSHIKII